MATSLLALLLLVGCGDSKQSACSELEAETNRRYAAISIDDSAAYNQVVDWHNQQGKELGCW